MEASEKRARVIESYQKILGINKYNRQLRDYCFVPYVDGENYSDSSSSIVYSYERAGFPIGNFDELGLYQTDRLVDVPVEIRAGVIRNPEILRIGDILFFAGTDTTRGFANYCSSVEMVYHIGNPIMICGHNSKVPTVKELNPYCKSRYHRRTGTLLGHCGLIKVRRFIEDDA